MIGRDRLDLGLLAFSEAGTTSFAAQMAGFDPGDLVEWAHDATEAVVLDGEEFSTNSIHAGLLATGVLIGFAVGRQA